MWYMDPATYGRPDATQAVENTPEFVRDLSTVGPGHYRRYDPAASQMVAVSWLWPNEVFAQFRAAWQTDAELANGANWLTIDLVLGTGSDGFQNTPDTEKRYIAHFADPYAAALAGFDTWRVTATLEVAGEV